jgi:hypothetical protein
MKLKVLSLLVLGLFLTAGVGICEEKVLVNFENDIENWETPNWCLEKPDYVAESIALSDKYAKAGKSSLEVMTNFTGGKWTAAYVEVQQFFDWTPYKNVFVDVYLPKEGPMGLQAKIILTVGDDWTWTEMSKMVKLIPGEWVTVTANLVPGSTDWRRTQVTDQFRADIRKFGVRIESNMRPTYTGPIYIDNIRLE